MNDAIVKQQNLFLCKVKIFYVIQKSIETSIDIRVISKKTKKKSYILLWEEVYSDSCGCLSAKSIP